MKIKLLVFGLLASVGLFAQSFPANSPFTPTSVITPYDSSGKFVGLGQGVTISVTATDQDYYKSRPVEVQAIYSIAPGASRVAAAHALAAQGFIIDNEIEAQAQSPMLIMYFRELYGYTWVPNALGSPVYLPPGLFFPGLPTYDPKNPPAGAITVSVAKEDYPPVNPPPPAPTPQAGAVGPYLYFTSDLLSPPVIPAKGVYSTAASGTFVPGVTITTSAISGQQGTFTYYCLGNSLMDTKHRICVWLGPLQ